MIAFDVVLHVVGAAAAAAVLGKRSGANVLNAKNDKPLRAGQVFTVSLGVAGLRVADATDARAQTYALQVHQVEAVRLLS